MTWPKEFPPLSRPFLVHPAVAKCRQCCQAHQNSNRIFLKDPCNMHCFYNCQLGAASAAFEEEWGHPVAMKVDNNWNIPTVICDDSIQTLVLQEVLKHFWFGWFFNYCKWDPTEASIFVFKVQLASISPLKIMFLNNWVIVRGSKWATKVHDHINFFVKKKWTW